jgi:hypothetical protein
MKSRIATVLSVSLVILLATQTAEADRRAMFKRIGAFSGAGCEQGSVVVAGENTETISVLFGKYDAGRNSRSGALHTQCEFSLPISVPPGQRLSGLTAEWQGYVKGRGGLSRLYSAVGPRQRPWRVSRYNSAGGTNYLERDDMYPREINRDCSGGELNVRIRSDIIANGPDSYIAVDTLDLQNQVVFRLNWVPCQ